MLRRWPYVAIPALALIAAASAPQGHLIVQQGSAGGAPACVGCHGPLLQGMPGMKAPAIAGRPAAFIRQRLDHYDGPTGHNPLMRQVAHALKPDERQAVADYIATLPAVPVR
jgi:cytochrome c553